MGKLTVREIDSAKALDKPYKLMDGDGLQLRVATDGTKTWLVRYVIHGVERQYRLPREYRAAGGDGFYTLQEARAESAKIRALAREGVDYQKKLEDDRNALEQARLAETLQRDAVLAKAKSESITFLDLFEAWVPNTSRKDEGAEIRRLFKRDVPPEVGTKTLKLLTEQDFKDILANVVSRGSNRMAVMLLGDLKQMFRWADKRKPWKTLIEDNPVELIDAKKITAKAYKGSERSRTLTVNEIKELTEKLPDAGLTKRTELAIWIMLSCCCRIGEIIKARWEHIDLESKIWIIPAENAKNENAHAVYLSDFSVACFKELRELSGQDVWCYPDTTGKTHVCIKSTTKQIRDRQVTEPGRKIWTNRSKKTDALILGGGDWVPHDLRRTGATFMQSLGITPGVIERVLNHIEPSKLIRTYQRYDYAGEKRDAWSRLGNHLAALAPRPATLADG